MVRIFVEGSTDKKFLTDLIQHRLTPFIPNNLFVMTRGWTLLFSELNINQLQLASDQGDTILVIFDADDDFQKRREVLFEKAVLHNITFSLFLFPNDKDVGDRETLLQQIATADKYAPFSTCFDAYITCLTAYKMESEGLRGTTLAVPNRKIAIYNYLKIHGQETNERKRDYTDSAYWNLYHPALEALIQFLTPFFSEQNPDL